MLWFSNSSGVNIYTHICICKLSLVYTSLCEISGDTRAGHVGWLLHAGSYNEDHGGISTFTHELHRTALIIML